MAKFFENKYLEVKSASQVKELVDNGIMTIQRQPQKGNGFNFIIEPCLLFECNGNEKITTANDKFVVYDLEMNNEMTTMLDEVDLYIKDYLKRSYIIQECCDYGILNGTLLRCYYPYNCKKNIVPGAFNQGIKWIIKNIWQKNGKMGYNILMVT